MKLSIVTVNRDNAQGLARTLRSTFEEQRGFDDWEQIVVDGASTDGSFAEIDRFRGSPRLGWCVSEPDAGIYNAMNKGAAHARGDYLLFLNSGDELLPDVLERIFADPCDVDIVYGDMDLVLGGKPYGRRMAEAEEDICAEYFLLSTFPHQSTIISADLHRRFGGYDEALRIVADRQFFLRAFRQGQPVLRRFKGSISRFEVGGVSSDPGRAEERVRECAEMLEPFFGRFVAQRAAFLSETRPWMRESFVEAASDPELASSMLRVSDLCSLLWRSKPGRGLLRAFRRLVERREKRILSNPRPSRDGKPGSRHPN